MVERSTRRVVAIATGVAMFCATSIVAASTPAAAADDLVSIHVSTPQELADAITAANADLGAETIVVTADLTLTAPMPPIRGPLTIEGLEADRAIDVDTAGFQLVAAEGWQWDEPAGAADEIRLAVNVRNLTITGGRGGGGSMMRTANVHTTIDDVSFVDNIGGGEGNIYSLEGGTSLHVHDIDVTGQDGTLLANDHGNTPHDGLDTDGNFVLADADYNNRMYVEQSRFTDNTGCVISTHRFVAISDSSFTNSDSVCLNGVSTRRLSRSTFSNTALSFENPWDEWNGGPGTAYVQLADVAVSPSITINNSGGGRSHIAAANTRLCGQPIESFVWSNPLTGWTMLGDCPGTPPVWTDQTLPAFELGVAHDDAVAATGDPAPTYSVSAGALPAGITFDGATGAVAGSPTTAGPYAFEITAANPGGSITAGFAGTITAPTPPPSLVAVAVDQSLPITADGVVQVVSATGVRVRLDGAESTATSRVQVTSTPLGPTTLDRGIVGASTRHTVIAHAVGFDALEVCVPFDRPAALAGRSLDRIRLVHTSNGVERDVTTRVDGGPQPLACGTVRSGGTFQVIVHAGDRMAGADRYATAAALALQLAPDGAATVYIASGEHNADATVAAVTAEHDDAPLLLVQRTALPAVVAATLTELGPGRIVVVGGPEAISVEVVELLRAFAPVVDVVDGADRYATAAAAALANHPDGVDRVYLVSGRSFADAATGGASAARDGSALLLVPSDHLPAAVAGALGALDPTEIVVVGGPAAISESVLAAVRRLAPAANVERISGVDRYATATHLAGGAGDTMVVVTGADFADAVLAIGVAGRRDATMVLIPAGPMPPTLRARLADIGPRRVVVVGGPMAVEPDDELALARIQPLSAPAHL